MREERIDGYVVVEDRPLSLVIGHASGMPNLPDEGILMYSTVATVFKTEADAQAASQRTRDYADKHDYDWMSKYNGERILPVSFQ
jgi:hypothetical protein